MADVVLYHSVLGIRPGVTDAAERFRAAGHTVHVPDLYRGEVFDDYPPAFGFLESIGGIGTLIERTLASVANLPAEVVYAGFSNGGASAEFLAATRPGARGALLFHAAMPVAEFGAGGWPASVPAQVHYATDDPFREQAWIDGFAADVRASGAGYEFFEYPVSGHLITDPSLPEEYHPEAAETIYARALEFLDRVSR